MRFFQTGLISALVAMATAYTTPDYSVGPSGNAILTPGLQEQVPAGKPYTITWDPTTEGTVSLVLLRGPSTNVQPLYALAESIPNNGHYQWTPSTDLEADVTHYGLLLVVESGPNKGAYQWSTQFGIKNPVSGHKESSTTEATAQPTAPTQTGTVTEITTVTTTTCPEAEQPTAVHSTSVPVIPTGVAPSSTFVQTPSPSAPAWTPTFSPAPPTFTGAAGRNVASFGAIAAGVAAVLAF
ncbi:Ser-Thr-rich glycosyl-phosphatidyl-inositol-anchored membrane family-domain-containing protein [Aspergillus unguis]